MTLQDISHMLKFAGVPRCKVVEAFYPKPQIIVHVPASHLLVIDEVMKRLIVPGHPYTVTLLSSKDVKDGELVYVKVKGDVQPQMKHPGATTDELRRYRMNSARARNSGVVVETFSNL